MGFLSRMFVPRAVRRAMHPVRSANWACPYSPSRFRSVLGSGALPSPMVLQARGSAASSAPGGLVRGRCAAARAGASGNVDEIDVGVRDVVGDDLQARLGGDVARVAGLSRPGRAGAGFAEQRVGQ